MERARGRRKIEERTVTVVMAGKSKGRLSHVTVSLVHRTSGMTELLRKLRLVVALI